MAIPVQIRPVPLQQQGLSLVQVIAGGIAVVGMIGLAESIGTALAAWLNPPKKRKRAAQVAVLCEEVNEYEWIFGRTAGRCFYCGKLLSMKNKGYYGGRGAHELDHFIPFSRGGADQPHNLVAACVGCNRAKSDKLPHEFMPTVFRRGDRNPQNYF